MPNECTGDCGQDISQVTVADVFGALWSELRSTIGSAPAAALLRRAIAVSKDCCPVLDGINIERSGRDYIYQIPHDLPEGQDVHPQLERFVQNALDLLGELMGDVLVNHLGRNPLIRALRNARSVDT